MKSKYVFSGILIFLLIAHAAMAVQAVLPGNLSHPASWRFESQRSALLPVSSVNNDLLFRGSATLSTSGGGREYSNGCWYAFANVNAQTYYRFQVYFKTENVEEPYRTVIARILWIDKDGAQVFQTEYPAKKREKSMEGWEVIDDTYAAPDGAVKARIELVYRWDADGKVNFGGMAFEQTSKPEPRLVRLATVHYKPYDSKSSLENLSKFAEYIAEAGKKKADIVCLPEALTMVGTGMNYVSASEPIPGPSTTFLGEVAKKHQLYIIAGLLEKDGDVVYNTSVLIDRNGKLAGKYRKSSLPREEYDGGISPGDSFPVFQTDFGNIGMMICWDVTFPEAARALAFKGAEVILMPIAGGHLTLAKARALENQVYLVSSTYDMNSAVFGLDGEMIAEATNEQRVVVVEVDLKQRKYWPWLGDFRNRIWREIPSEKSLTQEQK